MAEAGALLLADGRNIPRIGAHRVGGPRVVRVVGAWAGTADLDDAARRLFARDDVGWLAGAVTATSLGYVVMARMALPDLPLTFCITLAIRAALERRFALAGVGLGLGFLMKGPVALVVPAIVLLPIWWRERALTTLRVRDVATAGLLFAVIGLPW